MYRIFIVEDEETIASLIKSNLEKWGFEIKCAENFKRITEEISAFSPQLVLMDIGLPFYNGFYWCSEIRRISKVPVVFLSSAADNMNIVMAMNMEGNHHKFQNISFRVHIVSPVVFINYTKRIFQHKS